MPGKIALDTSAAIAALKGDASLVGKLQNIAQVVLPVTVIGELVYGALNSSHAEKNLAQVNRLIQQCGVLETSLETATRYAGIRLTLKQKGRPIPENDLWIAASCIEHQIPLMTADEHFTWIEGLTVETV